MAICWPSTKCLTKNKCVHLNNHYLLFKYECRLTTVFMQIQELYPNKIENGHRECFKETTTLPKIRKQPKATNGSSKQARKSHGPPTGNLTLFVDIN